MKALDLHWNPLKAFHESPDAFRSEFSIEPLCLHPEAPPPALDAWNPKFDVVETAGEYWIQADLPGSKREAIKISVEEDELTVFGERPYAVAPEQFCRRLERDFGLFARSFALPPDAVAEISGVQFQDGVLTIRLAKKAPPHREDGSAADRSQSGQPGGGKGACGPAR